MTSISLSVARQIASIILLCVILLISHILPAGAETSGYIDIHMHFNNQLSPQSQKQGQRPSRQGRNRNRRMQQGRTAQPAEFTAKDYLECADNMVKMMDSYGIAKVVVMPQPRLSGQPGYYDYRKIIPSIKKYPDRLVLGGGGGILNSMIHATDTAEVTEAVKISFEKEARAIANAGAKAFAELCALHVSLKSNHVFEETRPDHPLFLLLADIAAEYDMPIDIHMEAVVSDTETPANLLKASSLNPKTLKANIPAFERLLRHNRKTTIVWQHIGWDNIGQMTIPLLRRMLNDHPNLYLGFKIEARPYQMASREPMPNRMVDSNNHIKSDWLEFFKDYPDRLLVACDEFIGIPARTMQGAQSMEATYTAIEQLSKDVLMMVARENAIRLYNLAE